MLITGREHIVFLAKPPSIRFRHAILCKKADVLFLIQSGKTLWLVQCNTYIAAGVIRLSLMVLAERRHFTVPIYRALSRPDKTSEQPFNPLTLDLFKSSFDDLNKTNRWVILGDKVPWAEVDSSGVSMIGAESQVLPIRLPITKRLSVSL